MAIIKQLNKKTGITYVYESHSFRDKTTKKPRSTRKLIGRIDDATGEIIPTRKKRNINTTASEDANNITTNKDDAAVSLDIVKEKDAIITEQRRQISSLLKEKEELAKELEHLAARLHQ
jgi:hypothetical protein